jgi:hypothetical protein
MAAKLFLVAGDVLKKLEFGFDEDDIASYMAKYSPALSGP